MSDIRNKRKITQPLRTSGTINKIVAKYNREKDVFITTRGNISREAMKKIIPDVAKRIEEIYPELQPV
ncbi:hypothetical protein C4565_08570 [Candidatus Parcubacteria bacterium]|jgi:uncharacterized protein (DUF2267 family)|nr:MAG: hypothetical protein C4565_08570 [Candidatus Parcubacteria bacterium]